mmetsp:Transcript_133186/g.332518  ORF Transcript_133186/g.332518 Transcript_133186/m.332518 type:complete len:475 (+) Transcript_133186:63-1487(+)
MALFLIVRGSWDVADNLDPTAPTTMACSDTDDEEHCALRRPQGETPNEISPMAEASEEMVLDVVEERQQLWQDTPGLRVSRRPLWIAMASAAALLATLAPIAIVAFTMRAMVGITHPPDAGLEASGGVIRKFSSQADSLATPQSHNVLPPDWKRIGPSLAGSTVGGQPSNISGELENLLKLNDFNDSWNLPQQSGSRGDVDIAYPSTPTRIMDWRPRAEFATRCVIDVTQGASHLGQAITATYGASQCKDDSKTGCAANVLGILAALAQASAFLSLAASHCSGSMISEAMCSEDISDMSNALLEIAQSAAGVVDDCNYVPLWGPPEDWNNHHPTSRRLHQRIQLPFPKSSETQQAELDRKFDQTNCGLDIVTATMYSMNSIFLIKDAATNCPDPAACTVDVLNVLATFAYVAQYLSLVASDCPIEGNQRGACSSDIADIVGSAMSVVAVGIVLREDCTDHPNKTVEAMFSHLPR